MMSTVILQRPMQGARQQQCHHCNLCQGLSAFAQSSRTSAMLGKQKLEPACIPVTLISILSLPTACLIMESCALSLPMYNCVLSVNIPAARQLWLCCGLHYGLLCYSTTVLMFKLTGLDNSLTRWWVHHVVCILVLRWNVVHGFNALTEFTKAVTPRLRLTNWYAWKIDVLRALKTPHIASYIVMDCWV